MPKGCFQVAFPQKLPEHIINYLSVQEESLVFCFLALGDIYQKQKLLKVSRPDFGERLKSLRTRECPEGRKESVCGAGWG